MGEPDLTIIMLTVNKLPPKWTAYHRDVLLLAAGDFPIIVISRLPIDWTGPAIRNVLQEEPEDDWEKVCNVYRQILRGAELATTPYVAVAEDDCLYPGEHFVAFRPDLGTFAYNHTRWSAFAWETRRPFYYHMPSDANCLMIAPRELLIQKLRYPRITRRVMHHLQEPCTSFYTYEPVLCYYHDWAVDPMERRHRKHAWPVKAFQIPRWGKAKDMIRLWT